MTCPQILERVSFSMEIYLPSLDRLVGGEEGTILIKRSEYTLGQLNSNMGTNSSDLSVTLTICLTQERCG